MKQRGFTLTELMVSMVISLLCIATAMTFYAHFTKIGITATRDAQYDSQLTNGLNIAQKLILDAGYASGSSSDYLIISVASLTGLSSYTGNAIVWRYLSGTDTYTCQGIADIGGSSSTSSNKSLRRLVFLTGTSCTSSAVLSTYTWSISQDLARIPIYKAPTDSTTLTSTTPIFTFTAASSACLPYGLSIDSTTATNHPLVTITATSTLSSMSEIKKYICLININLS